MSEIISSRGHSVCRGCGSSPLANVLNLGCQPLPAEYGLHAEDVLEIFPLHLRVCPNCGLGQLAEYVLPDRIFHNAYPYLSSTSSTWVEHARQYVKTMKEKFSLDSKTLVLELASNDGYLLKEFDKLGVPVLGVEPAANVASVALKSGVPTINDFFGVKTARKILAEYGHPRLIVANNVYAHIPDMQDFTEGMAILANEATVITIENPTFVNLLKQTQFDTIYHEHYSYLTAHAVRAVVEAHALHLIHVDHLPTHGGSNRYWISRVRVADETVATTLDAEKQAGLFDHAEWSAFASRARKAISDLRSWLLEREQAGDVVVGYGAAHKGNSFLNSVGESAKILRYVVDASPAKQGKFLPGSQVPVLAPEQLNSVNPTDVLILPWNIAGELAERIRTLAPQSRIWVARPTICQLQ